MKKLLLSLLFAPLLSLAQGPLPVPGSPPIYWWNPIPGVPPPSSGGTTNIYNYYYTTNIYQTTQIITTNHYYTNTYITNITNIVSGGGGFATNATYPAFLVAQRNSGYVNVANNVHTLIPFDTVYAISNITYNASTGIVTIQTNGVYQVTAYVMWQNAITASDLPIYLWKNGSPNIYWQAVPTTTAWYASCSLVGMVTCVQGDTLAIDVWQSSGTTQQVSPGYYTYLNIFRIPQ